MGNPSHYLLAVLALIATFGCDFGVASLTRRGASRLTPPDLPGNVDLAAGRRLTAAQSVEASTAWGNSIFLRVTTAQPEEAAEPPHRARNDPRSRADPRLV